MTNRRIEKLLLTVKTGNLLKLQFYEEKYGFDLETLRFGSRKRNILHIACKFAQSDIIYYICTKFGKKLNVEDKNGKLPVDLLLRKLSPTSEFLSQTLGDQTDYISKLRNLCESFDPTFCDVKFSSCQNNRGSLSGVKEDKRSCAFQKLSEFCENFNPSTAKHEDEWWRKLEEAQYDNLNKEKDDWYSKLEDEVRFETDVPSNFNEHYKHFETYDEWANRIHKEYKQKHRYQPPPQPKKNTKQKQTQNHSQKKILKPTDSTDKARTEYNHVCRILNIEMHKNKSSGSGQTIQLKPASLPKFVRDSEQRVIKKVLLSNIHSINAKRKYLKEQLKIWHPDKFLQRFQCLIQEKHVNSMKEILNKFSQSLSAILTDLNEQS